MKITTSLIPELVWYTCYSECTVEQWLLQAFIDAPDYTLSLPDIWKIKVNWNRLIWSYWKAIMSLRKKWYDIETNVFHDIHKHITRSYYTLKNPTHNPDEAEIRAYFSN